jgi:TP901 family phage tail tape measure protein
MPQENFDRLGSTVVALGNNLATTEAEISSMAMRLAGAGTQIGLSEADIMAFAGALSSVGIEAEMGGSAFSKAMTEIDKAVSSGKESLEPFAQIAKMTAADFATLWGQDAAQAMIAFTEGLGAVKDEGGNLNVVLDEIGFKEVRLSDAMKRLGSSGDLLSNSFALANQAWEENSALATEAEQRYGTMESQLTILSNSLSDIGITVYDTLRPAMEAGVAVVTGLVDGFKDLPQPVQQFLITTTALVGVMGAVKTAIALVSVAKAGYVVLTAQAAAITATDTLSKTANTTANVANALSIKGITTAMLASPLFGIAVGAMAIGGIITAVDYLTNGYERQRQAIQDLTQEYNDLETQSAEVDGKLEDVKERIAELEAVAPISYTTQEELDRLKLISTELESQSETIKNDLANKQVELDNMLPDMVNTASDAIATNIGYYRDWEKAIAEKNKALKAGSISEQEHAVYMGVFVKRKIPH